MYSAIAPIAGQVWLTCDRDSLALATTNDIDPPTGLPASPDITLGWP